MPKRGVCLIAFDSCLFWEEKQHDRLKHHVKRLIKLFDLGLLIQRFYFFPIRNPQLTFQHGTRPCNKYNNDIYNHNEKFHFITNSLFLKYAKRNSA